MGCTDDPGCRETLDHVDEYLDNELDATELAQVREHLAECDHCLHQYGLEREVRTMIARSCCCHAPEELRQRIITRITEIRMTTSYGPSSQSATISGFAYRSVQSPFEP